MDSAVNQSSSIDSIENLTNQMESLREAMVQMAESAQDAFAEIPSERLASAENLLHYLALRSRDIRGLQDQLTRAGLSSLGGAESHVLASVDAVLNNLYKLSGSESPSDFVYAHPDIDESAACLVHNTQRLFGKLPDKRRVFIMVTMPAGAADDYMMLHQLLLSGMNCMRINCAHDEPASWKRMVMNLRDAVRATGHHCRVLMDLGGPKLRLGPMRVEPAVVKIRPVRAVDGGILRPARIWLSSAESDLSEASAADASLLVDPLWLAKLSSGNKLGFLDTRGSRRTWRIKEVSAEGAWAESRKTCYVSNGTLLHIKTKNAEEGAQTEVSGLAPKESVCLVRCNDTLILSAKDKSGRPALIDSNGELMNPGRVSLTIPEIYRDVCPGEPVFFDDGRISGIVEKKTAKKMQIRIIHTQNPVEKLEGHRGVNFPDSHLNLAAIGARDEEDIEFAAKYADIVGLSFANCVDDVRALYKRLRDLGRDDLGVILKIETKRGFSNLPDILLEALKFPSCGVMIARGDLAVECGFERLSEIQEEILWICESAHVPVIWATQVLEELTKRGHASRAEITDAAMSQAAEAVMLNKGPHIIAAVEMLDNILQRMQGHHRKKHSRLRKLHLASQYRQK